MVKIWNEKLKDILVRAFKTFIQGFLATMIVLLKESDLSDMNLLKSVLIGALAGGISAVMNLVIKALEKELPEEYEDAGELEEELETEPELVDLIEEPKIEQITEVNEDEQE